MEKQIISQRKKRKVITANNVIFAAYIAVNVGLSCCHEPWRDEAQSWLISRDCSIAGIVALMKYEGHPCLWHLLLYPFAHFGAPYFTEQIVSLGLMIAAAYLLVYRSPFSPICKAAVCLSPLMTYFYPIISRSYSLIPVMLFLLAFWYPTRLEHPLRYTVTIALLVQTHVMMVMTCFVLCVIMLAETVKRGTEDRSLLTKGLLALTIPFISALFLAYELMGVKKSSEYAFDMGSLPELILDMAKHLRQNLYAVCGGIQGGTTFSLFVAFMFVACACVFLYYRHSATDITVVAVFMITTAYQMFFYAVIHHGTLQRFLVLFYMFVWGLWIITEEQAPDARTSKYQLGQIVLIAVCCMMFSFHGTEIYNDIICPYSNAKEVSDFIKNNLPDDAVIYADWEPGGSAVLPYLNQKQFTFAANNEKFTYIIWDDNWDARIDSSAFMRQIDGEESENVYLLHSIPRSNIDGFEKLSKDYELVYKSEKPSLVVYEDYEIYRLK